MSIATRYTEYRLDKVERFMKNKVKKYKSFKKSFDVTKVTDFSKHSGKENIFKKSMEKTVYNDE